MFKKILIHTRRSAKILILLAIAAIIIGAVVVFFYKTTYSVSINGVEVGYTKNKSELQKRISDYMENGDEEHVAFVQIQDMPDYKPCLLKRDVQTNDDEIFEKVKSAGVKYYRYYSIMQDEEEKLYVSSFEDAEKVISDLKEKNSENMDKLTIKEKYEPELKELTTQEEAVAKLYVERPKVVVAKKTTSSYSRYASSGSVNTATTITSGKANLGISLIRPVSGILSSRFGARSRIRSSAHTGLDIATSKGTPIKAAAAGTVTFSGWKGSYGNLLVITHSNGVQTYYGHCNSLSVSAGAKVSQGQTVGTVGSTGNSTGPHLHFEVRVNGVAYNPENYI